MLVWSQQQMQEVKNSFILPTKLKLVSALLTGLLPRLMAKKVFCMQALCIKAIN